MCYFKGEDSKLKTYSLLFISDSLTHNTVAVYTFQKRLILLLKERLSQDGILLTEVQYFSDGCSKQYKNKRNFINLTYHHEDFGVPAKWAFFATSHGKGPWDGVAGCTKREAALESLRRPLKNHIQTAVDFYNFVKEKFKNIQTEFVSINEIDRVEETILAERFSKCKTIKGTLGFHNFECFPQNHMKMKVKKFSLSTEEKIVSIRT